MTSDVFRVSFDELRTLSLRYGRPQVVVEQTRFVNFMASHTMEAFSSRRQVSEIRGFSSKWGETPVHHVLYCQIVSKRRILDSYCNDFQCRITCIHFGFWIGPLICNIRHDFVRVLRFLWEVTSWHKFLWSLVRSIVIPGDSWWLSKSLCVSWFILTRHDFWCILSVLRWGGCFAPPLIRRMSAPIKTARSTVASNVVRSTLLQGA